MRDKPIHNLFAALLVMAMLMSQKAEANTITFPNTPVKTMTVEGTWNAIEPHKIDPGKGIAYNSADAPDQIGVIALDATIPEASKKTFSGNMVALTADQLRELGKSDNPWILRYCAERGKPELTKIGGRTALMTDFWQDQLLRVATPNGAQCIDAGKYESHAFILSGSTLVHIYFTRSVRGAQNSALSADLAKKFRTIVSSIKWQ